MTSVLHKCKLKGLLATIELSYIFIFRYHRYETALENHEAFRRNKSIMYVLWCVPQRELISGNICVLSCSFWL